MREKKNRTATNRIRGRTSFQRWTLLFLYRSITSPAVHVSQANFLSHTNKTTSISKQARPRPTRRTIVSGNVFCPESVPVQTQTAGKLLPLRWFSIEREFCQSY